MILAQLGFTILLWLALGLSAGFASLLVLVAKGAKAPPLLIAFGALLVGAAWGAVAAVMQGAWS